MLCEAQPPVHIPVNQIMRKLIFRLFRATGVAILIFYIFLMWREPHLIYYPDRTPFITPAGITNLNLITSDGVQIHGWFIPAPAARVTVLLLHGNAGNISDRLEKIQILRAVGAEVCIIDYRGYGRSAGTPNDAGTYRDARAAYDYLTKTLHRSTHNIVVYGESLGSAVAVELATQAPVGGVIIEEAFTSVPDVAQKLLKILPVRWLVRNRYDTLHKISRLSAPLLIFHSRQDEMFPYQYAERLLAAAPEPKQLVELHGGHNDAFWESQDVYRQALRQFFNPPAL